MRYTEAELEIVRAYYPSGGTNEVQRHIHRSKDSIRHKAVELGLKTTSTLNKLNLDHLINPTTPEAAYTLGLLWGDGTVGKGSHYHVSIRLVADDFSEVHHLFEGWSMYVVNNGPATWKVCYHSTIGHKLLNQFLRDNDYTSKSTASPYKILSLLSEDLRRYFYRGWFDADGSNNALAKGHDAVCIAGAWNQDWSAMETLVTQLGIDARIVRQKGKRGRGSIFEIYGKKSVLLYQRYIYSGMSIGLSRKLTNYRAYITKTEGQILLRRSAPKNVSLCHRRFSVRMTIDKRSCHFGSFASIDEATEHHDTIAWKTYGDELMLNEPARFNPDIYNQLGLFQAKSDRPAA